MGGRGWATKFVLTEWVSERHLGGGDSLSLRTHTHTLQATIFLQYE